ncbi:MAG: type I DNA topoisomerase [Candidatus Hydrogenedentota bacterium]
MAKYLVVVESPAKARTINKFLGSNYSVKASYGHVRDLPKSSLGVDVDNNFTPKYVQLRDASKAVKDLKEAAAKADRVLIASDPDREGEAIGWHVAELLKSTKKPVDRIVFNEITKRGVKEAAQNPREIDDNLVNAQQARRVLDRLVGYKLSPLLQWRVRKGLSAGRVQSVAVRIVCDREDEIRKFTPEEYWTLDADLLTEAKEDFTARLHRLDDEKPQLPDADTTQAVVNALEGAAYRVASVEKKEVKRRAAAPFITSTLQQEASRKLRFSPRKTMSVAQRLYEGMSVGAEGAVGLITYMRTDSTRVSQEAVQEARSYIDQTFDASFLPQKPNFFASKKGAQDAHEAIRPTSAMRTPESVKPYLDKDQHALYTLIWQRFVASQMTPAVFDQTTVDIDAQPGESRKAQAPAQSFTFRATGSIMKFPGFTKLYQETKEEDNGDKNGQKALPASIAEGQPLELQELRPEQHFTKPPPRYTEATLVRALEEKGIGRPSTYAPTINTITERGYVEREKGRLHPTELGEQVNTLLMENFSDILDLDFTARLEEDLDHVEEGEREWHELLSDFYKDFQKDLEEAQRRMVGELGEEDATCPTCGKPMQVREGRFGPFIACTDYPECKTTKQVKKQNTEPTDEVCEKCGAPMVIRQGRFGKFMACSEYPKCSNTHNVDKDGNKVASEPRPEPQKTDKKCPKCGNYLLLRTSRKGEYFYGCEKYPKCKYTEPKELDIKCPREGCDGNLVPRGRGFIGCTNYPDCDFRGSGEVDETTPCSACGHPWTFAVRPKKKPHVRRCPKPGCGHEEPLPEESEEDAVEASATSQGDDS